MFAATEADLKVLLGLRDPGAYFATLLTATGVGPKLAVALMSALGVERGARAVREKNIALLSSVSGIGKKTAERLALELGDKVNEFVDGGGGAATAPLATGAGAALKALERLGYSTVEADRALREALAGNVGLEGETEALVRRALQVLTTT